MTAKRRICAGCGRPETVCLCPAMTKLDSPTSVIIWQDPIEAKHPLSTAPLLHKSLPNSRLLVGEHFSFEQVFGDLPDKDVAVVFPFEHDRQLCTGAGGNIRSLLLLDGTWRKVRKMILANPWLMSIPYVALQPASESCYEIRTSRRNDGLSTIEAGVLALNTLENTRTYDAILPVLERMVALQKGFGHKQ